MSDKGMRNKKIVTLEVLNGKVKFSSTGFKDDMEIGSFLGMCFIQMTREMPMSEPGKIGAVTVLKNLMYNDLGIGFFKKYFLYECEKGILAVVLFLVAILNILKLFI